MPTVYALRDVPPEVSAYGMAKYSRSNAALRDTLRELSEEKAANFLNTFYFSYGHASIADLAHVALAIEEVSLLAAMAVVDEPLWDGQERSTRYQNFTQAPYYRPISADSRFDSLCRGLFDFYHELYQTSAAALEERYPRPNHIKPSAYHRTMQARALDIARYALPLATLTSVGQVTSARVLEQQISRLLGSSYPEIQDIARQMKEAATVEAPFTLDNTKAAPVSPTLIKYALRSEYRDNLDTELLAMAGSLFNNSSVGDLASGVELSLGGDPAIDALAMAFYRVISRPFGAIRQTLSSLSGAELEDLIDSVFQSRGPHDEWPRFFRTAPLLFDMTMDVGAFRDFNRHRRLTKVVPDLQPELGFAVPAMLRELNLGIDYEGRLRQHYAAIAQAGLKVGEEAYLLPLAHRRRALFAMDAAEAAYIIELRSRSAGHFSYRELAVSMHHAIAQALPGLAKHIRVTPLEVFDPFER